MVSFTRVFALIALVAFPLAAAQTASEVAETAAVAKAVKDLRKFFPDLPESITTKDELTSELQKRLMGLNPFAAVWKPVKDSQEEKIAETDSRFMRGIIQCPCSPSNRTSDSKLPKEMKDLRQAIEDIGGFEKLTALDSLSSAEALQLFLKANDIKKAFDAAKEVTDKCTKDVKMEGCVNADRELRGKGLALCAWDDKTKKNIFNGVTVGSCEQSSEFRLADTSINEGCIAVEHLDGHVLQHTNHLMRPVLCANGFCATPNHAIEVKGEYTSMKRMCASEWECTKSVKLVNNLKVAANRRARISEDIVVTPYDFRFPKVAVWGVQMLEDVWNMLALSVCSGTLLGAAVLLLSKMGANNKL